MPETVNPIPESRQIVTPYLSPKDAARAIDFYKAAFGAEEIGSPLMMSGGRIGHAELRIRDSVVMIADEAPEAHALSPETLGGSCVMLVLSVEDVDDVFARALGLGAVELRPAENQFWGERSGELRDPFGYRWMVSTKIEEVSEEEVARRAETLFAAA